VVIGSGWLDNSLIVWAEKVEWFGLTRKESVEMRNVTLFVWSAGSGISLSIDVYISGHQVDERGFRSQDAAKSKTCLGFMH